MGISIKPFAVFVMKGKLFKIRLFFAVRDLRRYVDIKKERGGSVKHCVGVKRRTFLITCYILFDMVSLSKAFSK